VMDASVALPLTPVEQALYVPEMCTISGARKLTETELLFEIEMPGDGRLGHEPGQFVQLSMFGFGEAPLSVCSADADSGRFELCVRRAGSLTAAMHSLGAGDTVGIRGPFGKGFPVEQMRDMDVLVVAGGIGLAPLRSLIQHVLRNRDDFGRLSIVYGTRTPEQMLFAGDIRDWESAERTEVLVTVDEASEGWDGRVGVVTGPLTELMIETSNTVAAVVGPPVMYRFVLAALRGMGIPDEQTFLSLERRMECGVGKCGHCVVDGCYVCVDGPVFSAAELNQLHESL